MAAENNTLGGFGQQPAYSEPSFLKSLDNVSVSRWQIFFGLITAYWLYSTIRFHRTQAKVPGVGYPTSPIFAAFPLVASWIAAYRFMRNPLGLMTEGFAKHRPGFFRISTLQSEFVIVTDIKKTAEYLKASDDVFSFQDAANEQQQIPFTMGWGIGYRTYHTPVIRVQLTQSLKTRVPLMLGEIQQALDELIGSPQEYQPFSMYGLIATVVAQASNMVMIGPELAHNKPFLALAIKYAEAVVISAELIRPFPDWLKHILIRIVPVWARRKDARRYLEPMLRARLAGDFKDGQKPDDLLQWLMDVAPQGIERSIPALVERYMAMNVASIHTTTMTFSGAIYKLAAEPEKYAGELREELEQVLKEGPLSKDSLQKLKKMDSFLRESARFNNSGLLAMQRNARQEFKFSDGTVLPPGARVGAPTRFIHRDPDRYENSQEFDGFRFSKIRSSNEDAANKYQMVSTEPELHVFGHGKHACPGRFFATNEMKLMLAELIQRYDMKLAEGEKPNEFLLGTMCFPDTKLNVWLKARTR
ncbi:hypothetical protein LTS08_003739 [Lithohypha guttulata]|nr:hypothetical protein LTS08_003739 [Lithohypha guttulata]